MKSFYITIFFLLSFNPFGICQTEKILTEQIKLIETLSLNGLERYADANQNILSEYKELQLVLDARKFELTQNQIGRLECLTKLADNNNLHSSYSLVWANYHLGCYIRNFGLLDDAASCLEISKKHSSLISDKKLVFFICRELAGVYFDQTKYKEALNLFLFSLKFKSNIENYELASTYNNVALCYQKLDLVNPSFYFFNKGKHILEKAKNINDQSVYYLIEGNIGTLLLAQHKYKEAEAKISAELNFYKRAEIYDFNRITSLILLFKIAAETNKPTKKWLIEIKKLLPTIKNKSEKHKVYNSLLKNISPYLTASEKLELYNVGQKITNDYINYIEENREKIISILFIDKIKSLKLLNESEENQLKLSSRNNNYKTIIICILALGLIIILFGNRKLKKQNAIQINQENIIQNQKNELLFAKHELLENDLKRQKEQLNLLNLNLKIKKETEEIFLNTIKKLRKRTDVTIEEVIKEIQLTITNSKEIDKKLLIDKFKAKSETSNLIEILSQHHPELNKLEKEHCQYYSVGLSAKEIGQLTGQSEGAVRVYKNKIKNKLNLTKELSLTDYLIDLTCKY